MKLKKMNKASLFIAAIVFMAFNGFAQEEINQEVAEIAENTVETPVAKDTVRNFKKVKLDGIAAVVGDYVILDSDIEKTLIDLKSQGVSTADVTRCGLLGQVDGRPFVRTSSGTR